MSREKFDYEKEHDVVGYYPPVKGAEWFSAEGLPPPRVITDQSRHATILK
jgi:hypothetical protein